MREILYRNTVLEGVSLMECQTKDELEQHLSDIRKLASRLASADDKDAAVRAERFAVTLLQEHNASGHDGKRCPFATHLLGGSVGT